MEMVLSRDIAGRRIYPAVNIFKTGTRKEELLLSEAERVGARKLRNMFAHLNEVDAARILVEALKKYSTNHELLATLHTA